VIFRSKNKGRESSRYQKKRDGGSLNCRSDGARRGNIKRRITSLDRKKTRGDARGETSHDKWRRKTLGRDKKKGGGITEVIMKGVQVGEKGLRKAISANLQRRCPHTT